MKEINASIRIDDESSVNGKAICQRIERAGRVCYKSEQKTTDDSYKAFIRSIIQRGHESVLEHEKITVCIICDRGVSHEIVRHRIGSYSQESTRYCNYSSEKFDNSITFITPSFWNSADEKMVLWRKAMESAEKSYFELIASGAKPQEARSVLPNSLKTELYVTYDLREWRHFLKIRMAKEAHPQMRDIAIMIYEKFMGIIPDVLFDIENL